MTLRSHDLRLNQVASEGLMLAVTRGQSEAESNEFMAGFGPLEEPLDRT